jgi:hypothetical protein
VRDVALVHEVLERGRREAGLSFEQLWIECLALGATAPMDELGAFLLGSVIPTREQYDVVAQAVNERRRPLGYGDLPYGDELEL